MRHQKFLRKRCKRWAAAADVGQKAVVRSSGGFPRHWRPPGPFACWWTGGASQPQARGSKGSRVRRKVERDPATVGPAASRPPGFRPPPASRTQGMPSAPAWQGASARLSVHSAGRLRSRALRPEPLSEGCFSPRHPRRRWEAPHPRGRSARLLAAPAAHQAAPRHRPVPASCRPPRALRCRSIHRTTGAPTSAVRMPMGSSAGATMVRAMRSARTGNAAPRSAACGIRGR